MMSVVMLKVVMLSVIFLNVTFKPFMLGAVMMSVVMLNVVTLSVMVPYNFLLISCHQCYKTFLVTCASRQSFSLINLFSLV